MDKMIITVDDVLSFFRESSRKYRRSFLPSNDRQIDVGNDDVCGLLSIHP